MGNNWIIGLVPTLNIFLTFLSLFSLFPQQIRATTLVGRGGGEGDDFDIWSRSRQLLRPDDQMDLNDTELSEEVVKVLSAENRHLPLNQVIYSFKDGGYVPVERETNVVTIFECDGTAIHIESAEAKAQIARGDEIAFDPRIGDLRSQGASASGTTGTNTPDIDQRDKTETPDGAEGEGAEAEADGSEAGAAEVEPEPDIEEKDLAVGAPGGPKKKLTNQFNFCERAALTYS